MNELLRLKENLADQQATIRAYDELWALYEQNVQRIGINPDELRRPVHQLARRSLRWRQGVHDSSCAPVSFRLPEYKLHYFFSARKADGA